MAAEWWILGGGYSVSVTLIDIGVANCRRKKEKKLKILNGLTLTLIYQKMSKFNFLMEL